MSQPTHLPPTRRRLLAGALRGLGATLALVLWPIGRAHAKKVGIKLAQLASLREVGGAQALKIKGLDVLLVRKSEREIAAVNPMCTHKKCLVRYSADSGKLHCKCHKSSFELSGEVLSGPAKKSLATYAASLSDDQIVLTLPEPS